ncbi:BMP family ABC transporter substrate-binding protein [Deinococcus sp. HMF7604]|uniref:BMP family lipoprotein n=1 Tax=Deinococcus betulae TaxID=2873312 RepID=UPI001CCDC6C1|nr:BMP family ABC transporter substrate-binding protein [Deinococcus betulae]MBZ9749454.1 BMP family ABC transporter substrate-binding protein [Deinococcus betulae]
MKKILTLALALTATVASAQSLRVGLAYDAGGKFDKSFNQSAYEGSQRAVKAFGVQTKDFEPSDPSQTIQGIRSFANEGFDLTVGVGFANNASISQVAKENPDLFFGLVDDVSPQKNVASLVFQEEQGSYLVGYLAALNSSTGVLGFVGGMDIPLIHKFEAGYAAGAKAANPKVRVIAQYVGTTPDAWNNPAKAKEIAGSMRAKGADIIFAAAGASGNGVIDYIKQTQCLKAANLPAGVKFNTNNFASIKKSATYTKACAGNTRPLFFIGVDKNQNPQGDFDGNAATMNHGLTSMLKRVDNAVYALIKDVQEDKFKGGERRFGLKEGGVGYAVDQYNKGLITSAQVARVEAVKAKIISGAIKVPTK